MPLDTKKAAKSSVSAEIARLTAPPTFTEVPASRRVYSGENVDGLFKGFNRASPLTEGGIPDFDTLSMDIQGEAKTYKTTFIAGCERAVIAKFMDGNTASKCIQRCLAEIIELRDLSDFNRLVDTMLEYAAKHGTKGRFCNFVVDPTGILVNFLKQRELDSANTRVGRSTVGEYGSTSTSTPTYESVRDIPDANTKIFPKIGEWIASVGDKFRGFGWGFTTCTHYQLGYNFEQKRSEWRPNVPGSTAAAISFPADMMLVTNKTCPSPGARPHFTASFIQEDTKGFGARVPISGSVRLPDYSDVDLAPSITMHGVVKVEYERACKLAIESNKKFLEAVK